MRKNLLGQLTSTISIGCCYLENDFDSHGLSGCMSPSLATRASPISVNSTGEYRVPLISLPPGFKSTNLCSLQHRQLATYTSCDGEWRSGPRRERCAIVFVTVARFARAVLPAKALHWFIPAKIGLERSMQVMLFEPKSRQFLMESYPFSFARRTKPQTVKDVAIKL